jgi:alpha-1,6-mannosyltransferase
VASRPLRVVDCALLYGERSDGIRAYLEAKRAFASDCDGIEHHLLVPGAVGPSLPFKRAGGYRLPLGGRDLLRALEALVPDVVLLHDPFWKARDACRLVHSLGGAVVMVHHGAVALDARRLPGPSPVYARAHRAWLHRSYDEVDAVMSAGDTWAETGRTASIPLRFGLHPAFRPQPGVERGDHVLYAGRLAGDGEIFTLLEAAARSHEQWTLRAIGDGPAAPAVRARAAQLRIAHRLDLRPGLPGRDALAREYAAARCVVISEAHEVEAAACGAAVVACRPAVVRGGHPRAFVAGDATSLVRAIGSARLTRPDLRAAGALAGAHGWEAAFKAELRDLKALAGW